MKILLIFLLSMAPLFSHAGFTKGNGGNILVCRNSQNVVLDYFEMKELFGFSYNEELKNLDQRKEFFKVIQDKINSIDADLANEFQLVNHNLESNSIFIDVTNMGKIDDVFDIFLPIDCELTQAIIQRNNRLIISKPLFESISTSQQNILILHEVLYSLLLKRQKLNDSRPVRALVSFLISQNQTSMTNQEVLLFMKKNQIFLRQ
ncbi:MAG: hypothetical protein HOP07_17670 [Bacteriovoracaceae bacterium]|nr:hypothetical protein [Bacteriovoracaceae bacterium]